jgi:hypothetical protein
LFGDAFQNNEFSPFKGPSSVADSFSFFNRKNQQKESEIYLDSMDLVPMASAQPNFSKVNPPASIPETYSSPMQPSPPAKAEKPTQTQNTILLPPVISDFYEIPQHPLLTTSIPVPNTKPPKPSKAAPSQTSEAVLEPIINPAPFPVTKSDINPVQYPGPGYPHSSSSNQTSSEKCEPKVHRIIFLEILTANFNFQADFSSALVCRPNMGIKCSPVSRSQVEMVMREKCVTINKTVCTQVQG